MSIKLGFEELKKKIIDPDICTSCGACVVTCPYKEVLEYSEGKPNEIGECTLCGICTRVCPRYKVQKDELEKFLFGSLKKSEEGFGIYKKIYVAKSCDHEILKQCQDGGVATTLINSALDSNIIDGAIVSGFNTSTPWLPVPFIAKKKKDVISCAGTRYTYSPNLLALKRCKEEGLEKIAFIGTPCQILAFRQIQKIPLKKFSNMIIFTIGLFCSESFTYDGLMVKKIQNEMGINLNRIEKMNIKGKMLLKLENGEKVEIPLKEAKKYVEKKCRYCDDFSAEFADISLGGVGLNGRTFSVLRTEQGEKIFDQALNQNVLETKSAEEFTRAFNLLIRLSKLKKRNVKNLK